MAGVLTAGVSAQAKEELGRSGAHLTSDVLPAAELAARAAASYRAQASRLMRGYQRQYGSRLTAAEQARVASLTDQGIVALAALESRSRHTATLARQGAKPARINTARQAAIDAHARATGQLTSAIGELQPLLAGHLGLFEALQAKGDLDRALRDLEAVGTRLRAVPLAR